MAAIPSAKHIRPDNIWVAVGKEQGILGIASCAIQMEIGDAVRLTPCDVVLGENTLQGRDFALLSEKKDCRWILETWLSEKLQDERVPLSIAQRPVSWQACQIYPMLMQAKIHPGLGSSKPTRRWRRYAQDEQCRVQEIQSTNK